MTTPAADIATRLLAVASPKDAAAAIQEALAAVCGPKTDMLTVAQFSRAIGMSRSYVYDLVDRGPDHGGVLAFRFGSAKGLRIPPEELQRIKSQCQVDPHA